MSEYVSDMPYALYKHVTGHILNAGLTHARGIVQLKALGNWNMHVVYTTCLKLVLNPSLTYSKCL